MASPAVRYNVTSFRSNKSINMVPKTNAWRKAPQLRHNVLKAKITPRDFSRASVGTRAPSARTDGQSTRMSVYAYRGGHAKVEPPRSIEAEHRLILRVSNSVQSDIKQFTMTFMLGGGDDNDDDDVTKCSSVAREALGQHELDATEINNASNLHFLLDSKLIDPKLKDTADFRRLRLTCDKHKRFSELIPRCKQRLSDCVANHLAKYCVSFIEETDGVHIKTVSSYEEKIAEMKRTLESYLQQCTDAFDDYVMKSSSFISSCLDDAVNIHASMDHLLNITSQACDVIRQWVRADKLYPSKLWDDVMNSNSNRGKVVDKQKKLVRRRDDAAQIVLRKELARDKIYQQLSDVRLEKKKHKVHKENLADRHDQTTAELDAKRMGLADVMYQLENRKSNSPKYFERLWDKKMLLEQQMARVEERLEMLQRQANRYHKMDDDYDRQLAELQEDVEQQNIHITDVRIRLQHCEQELAKNSHLLKVKEDTITTAKKVRDLKLAPQTLRKIYFQKLDSTSKGSPTIVTSRTVKCRKSTSKLDIAEDIPVDRLNKCAK